MPLSITPGGSLGVNGSVASQTPENFTAHPEMHPLKHIPSLITHLCNQEPTASAPAVAVAINYDHHRRSPLTVRQHIMPKGAAFGELWLNLNPSLVELQRSGVTCHRQYQILRLMYLVNIYGDHCQVKIGVSNNRDGTKITLTLLQCLQLDSDINWIVIQQQY
jgi:hypothetical protein